MLLRLLILSTLWVTACGQSGDLYLPDQAAPGPTPVAPTPAPSPVPPVQPEPQP